MRFILSFALLFIFAATAAAETNPTPAACWGPLDLAAKADESTPHRGAQSIAPPKRTLAEFTPAVQRGAVRRVKLPPGKKLIALTFDLCEQPFEIAGYQGGIVDFLRKNGIRATFFMGGKWTLSHRDRAQQLMSDAQFEVANHSWEHRNLRQLDGQALIDEIKNAQFAYEDVRAELEAKQCTAPGTGALAHEQAPKRLGLFRFPYGACNAKALDEVAAQGLLPIQWDVSSGDPTRSESAAAMKRQVLTHAQPGSIVLFHANGRGWHTEAALPEIVTALATQGYEFVTVSELLAAGEPVMTASCYDDRPGDTDRVAFLNRPKAEAPATGANVFTALFPWLHPAPAARAAAPKRSR